MADGCGTTPSSRPCEVAGGRISTCGIRTRRLPDCDDRREAAQQSSAAPGAQVSPVAASASPCAASSPKSCAAPLPDDLMLTSRELVAPARRRHADRRSHVDASDPGATRRRRCAAGNRRQPRDTRGDSARIASDSFAYPNGKRGDDYLPRHVAMVRDLGFAPPFHPSGRRDGGDRSDATAAVHAVGSRPHGVRRPPGNERSASGNPSGRSSGRRVMPAAVAVAVPRSVAAACRSAADCRSRGRGSAPVLERSLGVRRCRLSAPVAGRSQRRVAYRQLQRRATVRIQHSRRHAAACAGDERFHGEPVAALLLARRNRRCLRICTRPLGYARRRDQRIVPRVRSAAHRFGDAHSRRSRRRLVRDAVVHAVLLGRAPPESLAFFWAGIAMGAVFWTKELAIVALVPLIAYPLLWRRLRLRWLYVVAGGVRCLSVTWC